MRMKIASALSLFLVLILAFVVAGCPAHEEEAQVKIDLAPEELVRRVVKANRDVETYQYHMRMITAMRGFIAEETIDMQMSVLSHGTIDIANQRMRMAMRMTIPPTPVVPEQVRETNMYWLDGMVHMQIAMPGMPPSWTKIEMPWMCPLQQMVALLEVSEIDTMSVDKTNGVESYLLNVTPDIDKLWNTMMGRIMMPELGLEPAAIMALDPREVIRSASIQKWITRDTFIPLKEELRITMVVEGMAMEIIRRSIYHSFNEPVSIELPPEAAEAIEVPKW